MHRQLDPRLFGEAAEERNTTDNELLPNLERLPQDPSSLRAQLKKKENLEMKVEAFISKMSEAQRVMSSELTKLEKRFERLEQHYKQSHEGMQARLQKTDMRMTDRSMMENKIQALLERQNTMMQNFEAKLGQVKKALEEKEIDNLKLQSALREARLDIKNLQNR